MTAFYKIFSDTMWLCHIEWLYGTKVTLIIMIPTTLPKCKDWKMLILSASYRWSHTFTQKKDKYLYVEWMDKLALFRKCFFQVVYGKQWGAFGQHTFTISAYLLLLNWTEEASSKRQHWKRNKKKQQQKQQQYQQDDQYHTHIQFNCILIISACSETHHWLFGQV